MVEKIREMSETERQALIEGLARALMLRPEVSFAYVHGSFAKGGRFRDIDLAVFLRESPASPLKYELELEVELSEAAGRLPVDVRMLNGAPLSFRYHVIKEGIPLAVREDAKKTDFVEATLMQYLDFAHHRETYMKETIGLGI